MSFKSHNGLLFLSTFYIEGTLDSGRLNNVPQGPQLINKEASVHNYGAMTSELYSFITLVATQ